MSSKIRFLRPPITSEIIARVKSECARRGAKVRVRKLAGSQRGCIAIVLIEGTREAVQDAVASLDGATSFGRPFSHPDTRCAWTGPAEINACFPLKEIWKNRIYY